MNLALSALDVQCPEVTFKGEAGPQTQSGLGVGDRLR